MLGNVAQGLSWSLTTSWQRSARGCLPRAFCMMVPEHQHGTANHFCHFASTQPAITALWYDQGIREQLGAVQASIAISTMQCAAYGFEHGAAARGTTRAVRPVPPCKASASPPDPARPRRFTVAVVGRREHPRPQAVRALCIACATIECSSLVVMRYLWCRGGNRSADRWVAGWRG
jgi:hypothetical protein